MSRIRTVKPKLFTHEGLYDAEYESGLPLRLSFVGLFTEADREGRFQWRPRTLKAAILPFDDVDFSRVLDALATRGFLVKYTARTGELLGAIPTFRHHQAINNKEPQSELDPPSAEDLANCANLAGQRIPLASSTRKSRESHASPPTLRKSRGEGKGREGKGKEKTERPVPSRQSIPRARENDAGTDDGRTSARLREIFANRGQRLMPTTAAKLTAATEDGVTFATIAHALDVALAYSADRPGAYAVTTVLDWQRNGNEPHDAPLPQVDAHAMSHANGGKGISRRDRDDAFMAAITRRGQGGEVIDVDATEVSHVAEKRGA